MVGILSAAWRRTLRKVTNSWGLLAAGTVEVAAILLGAFRGPWSFSTLLESALVGLVPIVAVAIGIFIGCLISEPHIRLASRVKALESYFPNTDTITPAIEELKQDFLRLTKVLRSIVPLLGSNHGFPVDQNSVKEIEDRLIFYINETQRSSDLHNRLLEWFYGKDANGMSVYGLIAVVYRSSPYNSRVPPRFSSLEPFLRQKLVELQSLQLSCGLTRS